MNNATTETKGYNLSLVIKELAPLFPAQTKDIPVSKRRHLIGLERLGWIRYSGADIWYLTDSGTAQL